MSPASPPRFKHSKTSNDRFGEVAIQLGYLTESELIAALEEQRRQRPSLRKTIANLGFLNFDQVQAEFHIFESEFPQANECDGDNLLAGDQHDLGSDERHQQDAREFDTDPELLAEFLTEAKEHLDVADEQLLVIESDPANSEALNAIYRSFHTIKGVASFLDLDEIRSLAHAAESLLNLAREGHLTLQGNPLDIAFASVDGLRRQVGIAATWLAVKGKLGLDPQLPALLSAIESIFSGTHPAIAPAHTPKDEIAAIAEASQENELPIDSSDSTARPLPSVPSQKEPTSPAMTAENENSAPASATKLKESIKVDRDRLDKLINVIGELVIGQAMVEEEVAVWQEQFGGESLAMSQLNKTVRDLQELSLSLRMVPIGTAFHKMARIVRDLGRKLNKQIKFATEGEETELDKTVVDQIGDPLLHMVRNAADHGIETPDDRIAAGKPPLGKITLRAYHQGGNIYIEIEDDGKGLDREQLLQKAIEREIVSAGDQLTDQEIYNLIFAPGFSTAREVTDVSGRGVGMDVVRKNVEALQGSVSVQSKIGEGSTVTVRLPLTLAILDGPVAAHWTRNLHCAHPLSRRIVQPTTQGCEVYRRTGGGCSCSR